MTFGTIDINKYKLCMQVHIIDPTSSTVSDFILPGRMLYKIQPFSII